MKNKEKRLDGKVAIVTGSSRGIGEAIALRFAEEGATVVIADINENLSSQVVNKIKNNGSDSIFIHTDVSKEEDVKNVVASAIDKFGNLDILVNNAGVAVSVPIEDCTLKDYDYVHNVDLRGLWMLSAGKL